MSYEAAKIAIESTFETAWADSTPIAFDNVEFNVPTDGSSWVRLELMFAPAFQAAMGIKRTWRRPGTVTIKCHTPVNKGTAAGLALADAVVDILQGLQVSGITFRATSVLDRGQQEEWWLTIVATDFFTDLQQ